MTQAIIARRDGDTFQARMFWDRAARLLDEHGAIAKVGFEKGPKSFDDIWIEYREGAGPSDQNGTRLHRVHIQCKWHTTPNTFGYVELTDPEFINASAVSFLQRARKAQLEFAPDGRGIRFQLLTNWRLGRKDALRDMVSTRSSAMRLDRLYGSKTDNSRAGAVRKTWREHLDIDEEELRVLASTLAFGEVTDSLDDMRERLDMTFRAMGLRRVPEKENAFFYDDLVYQWMGQNRLEFDRESFRHACSEEGILVTSEPEPTVYGVKSFEHPLDHLDERCEEVLNFVPVFDGRYIHSGSDWLTNLYPKLKEFLISAGSSNDQVRLALDAHVSLAFAAGYILNIKSGRAVELEQRTLSRSVWSAEDVPLDSIWPTFEFTVTELNPDCREVAIAVGITHDIGADVLAFVKRCLPSVGRVLACVPSIGSSARSVVCGRHAFELAEALAKRVIRLQAGSVKTLNHLFIAAPNGFTFFAGQRAIVLGPTRLYEFDFEGERGGTYRPSLTLPLSHPSNDGRSGTDARRGSE